MSAVASDHRRSSTRKEDPVQTHSQSVAGEISANVALCCQYDSRYYDFEKLKEAVRRAVERADEREPRFGIRFVPLDDSESSGHITVQIEEAIKKAAFVIVDLSDVNVNAIYELGLARGTEKTVITLREQSAEGKLPFDLTTLRHFSYDGSQLGRLERFLEDKLVETTSKLDPEDLIPRDQVEQIVAKHLRVIEKTADFNDALYSLLDRCEKNLYYVGSAGLALSDDNWVQLCRTRLQGISAHRIVYLRTLKQVFAEDHDPATVEDYCIWLARYYGLVKDGMFALYSSPEVGSRRHGMSFLIFDEQRILVSMGRLGGAFNHKAILIDSTSAGRVSYEYAKALAITSRQVRASDLGRYFALATASREVPTAIAENASGDPGVLKKACIDYVTEQLAQLEA